MVNAAKFTSVACWCSVILIFMMKLICHSMRHSGYYSIIDGLKILLTVLVKITPIYLPGMLGSPFLYLGAIVDFFHVARVL